MLDYSTTAEELFSLRQWSHLRLVALLQDFQKVASETLQLGETKSGGGERQPRCQRRWRGAALRAGQRFTGSCVRAKEYLGTKSFPRTTDVTNSLEYSMASSLDKHNKTQGLGCVSRARKQKRRASTWQTQVLLHISSQEQIFALDETKFLFWTQPEPRVRGKLNFSREFLTFHTNISCFCWFSCCWSLSPSVLIFCLELAALTLLSTGHLSTTNTKATHLPDNLSQDWLKTGNDGSENIKRKESKHHKAECSFYLQVK